MKIGFLIIGSEVLDGKISDLNTKLLGDFLTPHQLEINDVIISRDDETAIHNALKFLMERNELIISTGGLGPTKDDITKYSIAQFLKRKISFSQASFKTAEENYQRMNATFPGKDHAYCFMPEGAIPLSNINGHAPGFLISEGTKSFFSAPGVPREFKAMLETHLTNFLKIHAKNNEYFERVIIRTKYIPEEKIFFELDKNLWGHLEECGEVSSLPFFLGVDIGVKVKASTPKLLAEKVLIVKDIFKHSPIKDNIWSWDKTPLEEKIVRLAISKKIKFGFAESATGGLCSNLITNVSGSSQCFMGSVICYDESIKEHVLGVSSKTLKEDSAVSLKCAEEMAFGLKEKFNLDLAISITGFAGPTGGNSQFPVGSVCIGTAGVNSPVKARSHHFRGDRELLKLRFAHAGLHVLLEELENIS